MSAIFISEIQKKDTRIVVKLQIDSHEEIITTRVSSNVVEYIVDDRIDAIVVGLMLFAIKNSYDFKSEIPISEELYYNLNYQFINSLSAISGLRHPRIYAPLLPELNPTGEIVATGISCGVDSLYTIYTHTQNIPPTCELNHLVFFNVGSHKTGKGEDDSKRLFEGRRKLCRDFAAEAGLGFIEISSDLPAFLDKYDNGYSHVENHTFMALFCIHWIQGGMKRFYYSSGLPFNNFSCRFLPQTNFDCANYDLLTLLCASHGGLRFISAGGSVSRFDKIKDLCDYPLAYRYLNVCVNEVCNDGTCFKCIRTILEIDSLGKLDLFDAVFDVAGYKKGKMKYMENLYIGALKRDRFLSELMPYFNKELTLGLKVRAIIHKLVSVIRNRLFQNI